MRQHRVLIRVDLFGLLQIARLCPRDCFEFCLRELLVLANEIHVILRLFIGRGTATPATAKLVIIFIIKVNVILLHVNYRLTEKRICFADEGWDYLVIAGDLVLSPQANI